MSKQPEPVNVLEEFARKFFLVEVADLSLHDPPSSEERWNFDDAHYRRIGVMSKSLLRLLALVRFAEDEADRALNAEHEIHRQPDLRDQCWLANAKYHSAKFLFEATQSAFRGLLLAEMPAIDLVLKYGNWGNLIFYKGGVVVSVTYPEPSRDT